MKLYLARHGETDWNAQHKAQGGMDIPLNTTGVQQAEALRDQIKNIDFAAVYSSPLQRAARTAQIATDGKYEIIYDDRLRERSFGGFEGQEIRGGWTETVGYDIDDLRHETHIGNIETTRSVLARTKAFLDDLKTRHDRDATILIVAHGQSLRGLHHNLVGYTDNLDWRSIKFGNAELREYDF